MRRRRAGAPPPRRGAGVVPRPPPTAGLPANSAAAVNCSGSPSARPPRAPASRTPSSMRSSAGAAFPRCAPSNASATALASTPPPISCSAHPSPLSRTRSTSPASPPASGPAVAPLSSSTSPPPSAFLPPLCASSSLGPRLAACGIAMVTDGVEVRLEPFQVAVPAVGALGRLADAQRRAVVSEEAMAVLTYVGWHGEATRAQLEAFRGEDSETQLGRLVNTGLLAAIRDSAGGRPNRYRLTT